MRTILDVYNHMAVFWNLCSQDDRAMKFLLHAETIYKQWESLSENDEDDVTSSGMDLQPNFQLTKLNTKSGHTCLCGAKIQRISRIGI